MKLNDILDILARNESANDWISANNPGGGGTSCYCREDTDLVVSSSVIWKASKPSILIELRYAYTRLGWFEIEIPAIAADQDYLGSHIRRFQQSLSSQ